MGYIMICYWVCVSMLRIHGIGMAKPTKNYDYACHHSAPDANCFRYCKPFVYALFQNAVFVLTSVMFC